MSSPTTTTARRFDTRKLATMAMLSGIGIVIAVIFKFPLIPTAPFLKYDPADIPILIGTLIYGPGAGFMMTVVVSAIQSFLVGTSGPTGFVMHVCATGAMALATGVLYHRLGRRRKSAALSLAAGGILRVLVMVVMNLIITPLFLGRSLESVVQLLVPAIIPFNILRSAINCALAFVFYRAIEKLAVRPGEKKTV